MTRPFRFGLQLSGASETELVEKARRAEDVGFDVVLMSDHVGPGFSPLVALAAIARATNTIRLGTFVLNADMRNPVHLAWEASTLDRLSNGRFELGVGAGHTPQEYAATSLTFRSARERKQRLAEGIEIMRPLLDGERVDHAGEHYQLEGAQIDRAAQEHLPILVGGNGPSLLAHAGAHADIVGLQGLGRTLDDGHRHEVRWGSDRLSEQIEQIRTGAGTRFEQVELNALVQIVEVTDDREAALTAVCDRVGGLSADDAAAIPYLLIGSVEEIAEKITACRERWGISYFVVRELEAFAPILAALRSGAS